MATLIKIKEIEFKGIDSWSRPIFKVVDQKEYYGSVNTLFNDDDPKELVLNYFRTRLKELEYFGTYFGCEPHGGIDPNITFKLIE